MKESNDSSFFKERKIRMYAVFVKSTFNTTCDKDYCLAVYITVFMASNPLLT